MIVQVPFELGLGGSTNGVLHFLAMANTAGVPLTLGDIDRASRRTPLLADLAPSGKYYIEDLYYIGGTPAVLKPLTTAGLIDGHHDGHRRDAGQEHRVLTSLDPNQIIRPLSDPSSHRATSACCAGTSRRAAPSPRPRARKGSSSAAPPPSSTRGTS